MADNWQAISGYASNNYSDTMVFEVGSETKSLQKISGQALVAGEKNSQYIRFKMSRYWDGIDVSEKSISIIYALAGKYYGETAAINAERTDDELSFGWVVPSEACCVAGPLLFVLTVKDDEYVLKSQIAEIAVQKSINLDDVIPEPTKELWYREFQARVETALSEAEAAVEESENALQKAQQMFGSPLVARTAAEMTDHDRVYVYTGSEAGYIDVEAEGKYTAGHWYYWDGQKWADGGVYNSVAVQTDKTLKVENQAADAKETGGRINELKNTLNEYETIFTDNVDESVQNWLDEHPEATTTVQDGSITREKFTESLNKRIDSMYDTAQDMIQDTSLISGMFVQTGGHESVHDGGGQLYRITSTKPRAQSSAEVPAYVFETLSNGLYAERVLNIKETKFSIADKIGNSYCGNFINNASVISELLDVCSSYEDNGDKLYYGHYSALDYGDHDVSNGEDNGKYQIDCSAFVQLALAGITFDSSRYNADDNYFVSQYSFFPYRTKEEYQNKDTWGKYRLSDCQAKYAYENGYAFLPNWDWSNVQAGDVVYLQDGNTESSNWGGVDHVMIYIGRRNKKDDLTFYECGGNSAHRSSVSSSNIVHVRTSTLAFMNANTKLIARYPLGIGDSNANCVIYENKHPKYPVTFSAGSRSNVYEIEPISKGEWYTVIAKVKSLNSHPFYVTDTGHQMVYPAIDSSAIFVNTFRAVNDFHAFVIGSYESTDGDIVFEDFKIVKGFGNTLNVPYHKSTTRVKKVETITVNYQNKTANEWEYVGLSITVPAGHRYLVRCTQGWDSGKPIGMALHTATSGMLTYTHESANDAVIGTPTYMLDSGTWYLFTKRATVATSANVYAITILDVDLS